MGHVNIGSELIGKRREEREDLGELIGKRREEREDLGEQVKNYTAV